MQLRAAHDRPLDELLAGVSRSFYLSLAVLPRSLRPQLSAAYLIARAADTIADTRAVPADRRRQLLERLRVALEDERKVVPLQAEVLRELGGSSAPAAPGSATDEERTLLGRLGDCLRTLHGFEAADRGRTQKVLATLASGMERDLVRFPEEPGARALETLEELDEHCYFAAGCVGEYWTLMAAAHVPGLKRLGRPDLVARGVRLGKALQLVNVIRDAPRDLQQGRCYWPRVLLAEHGLQPADLYKTEPRRRARAVQDTLVAQALAHVDAAWPYVLAIPRREARLRLASVWPLWIGLETLELLRATTDPLDPAARIKISRQRVYRIVAESTTVVASDRLLSLAHARRRDAAG